MRIISVLLLCCTFSFAYTQQKTKHTISFDFDKAVLSASAQSELTSLIQQLNNLQVSHIEVKGHTDKKGSDEYNNKLSQQRAEAVAMQLKKALPGVLIAISFFGEAELLAEDDALQDRNRRVEIFLFYREQHPNEKVIEVQGFYEDVKEQSFNADVSDTIIVRGTGGTVIKIPPGSLQSKEGRLVEGRVDIRLKEYYEPSDILLAGLHSSSDEGLLQTGGMFKIVMLQNGDTISTDTKKQVEIRMPVKNEQLTSMNVFTMNLHQDSSLWENTGRTFFQTVSYWDWPRSPRLVDVYRWDFITRFERFRIGATYKDEYGVGRPLIGWGYNVPSTKRVNLEIKKMDSLTLQVKAKIKYRTKGYKRLGIHSLDTIYNVRYRTAEYYTFVSNLNYINCDRFLKNKSNTEFFVNTPGYSGLNVMVYFKSQSGYMSTENINDGEYAVSKVPANEKVVIVAFGRKDNDYFFGKQNSTITTKGHADVLPAKLTKEEFAKALKSL